ncbi:MAG TPA: hypothetical protein VII09_01935, partial [Opitutaceae bacterium]
MIPSHFEPTDVGVIRFTRRIARQCARGQPPIPDWVVCDAIANGRRRRAGRQGTRGGVIFLFTKAYPDGCGSRKSSGATVRVLGEVMGKACFALQLLSPPADPGKIWDNSGFLNRA